METPFFPQNWPAEPVFRNRLLRKSPQTNEQVEYLDVSGEPITDDLAFQSIQLIANQDSASDLNWRSHTSTLANNYKDLKIRFWIYQFVQHSTFFTSVRPKDRRLWDSKKFRNWIGKSGLCESSNSLPLSAIPSVRWTHDSIISCSHINRNGFLYAEHRTTDQACLLACSGNSGRGVV